MRATEPSGDLPLNVAEYEERARALMEPSAFGYYVGGAWDERTLAANRSGFDRYWLRPRVLVDVSHVNLATTVLGEPVAMPILIAPTAFHRLAHPDGERATARAAAAAGALMVASTIATTTLEDIALAAPGAPRWFQLYVYKDRAVTRDLVLRAEQAGYRALVLTVDTPRLGRRERDARSRFALPEGLTIANLDRYRDRVADGSGWSGDSSFSAYVHQLFDASLSWDALAWLRSITRLPVLLKGVVTAEDARLAVEHGASAIVVSNHGGRQLDSAQPTIDALSPVVDAVAGAVEVLVDGGIRRGTDVLKALGLGARAVLIGRPCLWGLAVGGEAGVHHVLSLLRDELELALALAGRPSLAAVDRSLVVASPP